MASGDDGLGLVVPIEQGRFIVGSQIFQRNKGRILCCTGIQTGIRPRRSSVCCHTLKVESPASLQRFRNIVEGQNCFTPPRLSFLAPTQEHSSDDQVV